jgi:hypothetical protein
MDSYDFSNLSHHEFELLTRDLLQKKFDIHIESFGIGKDKGIDLRFAFSSDKKSIVQCKRYKNYNDIKKTMLKEREKLDKICFEKYYLATSVSLNPSRKEELLGILSPFLHDTESIFGKEDLNNLLSQFKDIELKYYKLWLASTNVLSRILHSRIINTSVMERNEVKRTVQTYVQNESFGIALEKLHTNRFLIISGIPGIGKTTLARLLVYNFLAREFEEFISVDISIADAFELYHEEKTQVFLYDDFLGRNFIEDKLNHNEDRLLYKFINQIRESKNKYLIMTTREYILKQAQKKHELFNRIQFLESKYILDLESYTKLIKAQILYNHIFFSGMEEEYINNLLQNKSYMQIINHDNYNPRIIETMMESSNWKSIESSRFSRTFIDYLNNPRSVWGHAFENQISVNSRHLLLILLTIGTPVLYDDLFQACQAYFEQNRLRYNININDEIYPTLLKELEGSFLTSIIDIDNVIAIDFINPSIVDYLLHYLSQRTHMITDLLDASIYHNQLLQVFEFKDTHSPGLFKKILVSDSQRDLIEQKLLSGITKEDNSIIYFANYRNGKKWVKRYYTMIKRIFYIVNNVPTDTSTLKNKIIEIVENYITNDITGSEIVEISDIYMKLKEDIGIEVGSFFKILLGKIDYVYQLDCFRRLKSLSPTEYENTIKQQSFIEQIVNITTEEFKNVDSDNYEYLVNEFEIIEDEYGVDLGDEIVFMREQLEEAREHMLESIEPFNEISISDDSFNDQNVDLEIESIFESLIEMERT